MVPEYPKFKTLEFKDRDILVDHLAKISPQICELSFANLMIWQEFDRPEFTFINDNLCILINPLNEAPFFLEPIGKNKRIETTNTCLNHCGKISRATEDFIFHLPEENYSFECIRSHSDYIYQTQALAGLKGKPYEGKRNRIKKFERLHPNYDFIPLDPLQRKEALMLFEEWFKIRELSRFFPKLSHNAQKKAVEIAFDNFRELNLIGGALMVEKTLKGFVLGSALNNEMVSVHFAYSNPELPGSAQILLWEACKTTFSAFKYVNLEQDLGIPGLRRAKLSYHPLKLERKFEVKFI